MAKVTAPLMSMSASGKFGGAMVFATNKGRNVVRQLVTPANPRTSSQIAVRNKLAVAAAIQKQANRATEVHASLTIRDEMAYRAAAPSGQTWNATVTAQVIGAGSAKYAAAGTAYAAANAGNWNTAALALGQPFAALSLPNPAGGANVTVSAGEQYFRAQYALYTAGILSTAPSTPPTYA